MSAPSTTFPKTTWRPLSQVHGSWAVKMANWQPLVFRPGRVFKHFYSVCTQFKRVESYLKVPCQTLAASTLFKGPVSNPRCQHTIQRSRVKPSLPAHYSKVPCQTLAASTLFKGSVSNPRCQHTIQRSRVKPSLPAHYSKVPCQTLAASTLFKSDNNLKNVNKLCNAVFNCHNCILYVFSTSLTSKRLYVTICWNVID